MLKINGNLDKLYVELPSENEIDQNNEQFVVEQSGVCVNDIQTSSYEETIADHIEH